MRAIDSSHGEPIHLLAMRLIADLHQCTDDPFAAYFR